MTRLVSRHMSTGIHCHPTNYNLLKVRVYTARGQEYLVVAVPGNVLSLFEMTAFVSPDC